MRFFVLVLSFLLLSAVTYAQEFNAGFVQGIWYDTDIVFAEKPSRVYVAIRNNTGGDITGTVEFFDNDKRIGRKTVSALDGRIIESWADWTPTYGDHTIRAELSRIELQRVGSSTESITVISAVAEDTLFVDYDTDNDGIGNEEDPDDDGDNRSDAEEKEAGTDPLVYDKEPANEDSEGDNDTEKNNDTEEEDQDGDASSGDGQSSGLEQYLTESPARTALSGITAVVQNVKKNIDDYREVRAEQKEKTKEEAAEGTHTASTSHNQVDTDNAKNSTSSTLGSFGTITRTQGEKVGDSFLKTVFDLFASLFDALYTFTLWLFSTLLAHPMLVQLGILFFILLLLLLLARKFGKRKN